MQIIIGRIVTQRADSCIHGIWNWDSPLQRLVRRKYAEQSNWVQAVASGQEKENLTQQVFPNSLSASAEKRGAGARVGGAHMWKGRETLS